MPHKIQKIILNKAKPSRILLGHPWIYRNEIDKAEGEPVPGDTVEVYDSKGNFLGRGFYNPKSLITVRLLTRRKEEVNAQFFKEKIQSCFAYRQKIGYTENYRLVFGEGDFLPALIIDKFKDVFVIQTLALGMDKWKTEIAGTLQELFSPAGIYERNDVPVRELEGLQQQTGFLSDPFNTQLIIEEGGAKFLVDVEHGQKTGFFLDQKENRMALQHISSGAEVLDCFCYTGSFSVYAAKFGAKNILAIDSSADAIVHAKHNFALNELSTPAEFWEANVFDALPQLLKEKKLFDVVILDPPAFTKSRSGMEGAVRGYKEINVRAMKLLRPGGFLLTFSCSYFMNPGLFFNTIMEAANDTRKTIRQVQYLSQAKDHPVVWNIDETNYLKGLLLQVS